MQNPGALLDWSKVVPPSRRGAAALLGSLVMAAVLSVAGLALAEHDPPSRGESVVEFCRQHMGERVGSGQCAALAFQALKAAGAQTKAGPDFPNRATMFGANKSTTRRPRRTGQGRWAS